MCQSDAYLETMMLQSTGSKEFGAWITRERGYGLVLDFKEFRCWGSLGHCVAKCQMGESKTFDPAGPKDSSIKRHGNLSKQPPSSIRTVTRAGVNTVPISTMASKERSQPSLNE